MFDPRLLEYATPRQREIAEAVISTGSTRQAAIQLGINHRNVSHALARIRMAAVLAMEAQEAWNCPHKYVYHGHIHQRRQVEEMGVIVECLRTLAPRDAWHAGQGYKSGREMVCIVLDKDHGEVERHTCGISRARAA